MPRLEIPAERTERLKETMKKNPNWIGNLKAGYRVGNGKKGPAIYNNVFNPKTGLPCKQGFAVGIAKLCWCAFADGGNFADDNIYPLSDPLTEKLTGPNRMYAATNLGDAKHVLNLQFDPAEDEFYKAQENFFNKEMFEEQIKWILENRKEVKGVSYEFDQLVKNEATEEDLRLFIESQKHNTASLRASRNEK